MTRTLEMKWRERDGGSSDQAEPASSFLTRISSISRSSSKKAMSPTLVNSMATSAWVTVRRIGIQ